MSARQCPTCRRYYRADLRDCPVCGPPWWRHPLRPGNRRRDALLIAGAVLLLLCTYHGLREYHQHIQQAHAARAAAAAEAEARKAAACRRDAHCWGLKHWADATLACRRRTERAARYRVRWPSGVLNPALVHWEWRDQQAGSLTYIGRAELQNGFGAWQPHIVGCLYDPNTGTAISVELRPGRL